MCHQHCASPAAVGCRPDTFWGVWQRDVSGGHHLQGPHCLPSLVQGRPIPAQPQPPQGQIWTCSQTPPWSYSRNTMPLLSTPDSSPTSPCQTHLHPPDQLSMPRPAPRGLYPTPSGPSKIPKIPRRASASRAICPRSPSSSHPLVPVPLFSQQVSLALSPISSVSGVLQQLTSQSWVGLGASCCWRLMTRAACMGQRQREACSSLC